MRIDVSQANHHQRECRVLILVLREDLRIAIKSKSTQSSMNCLNPFFRGTMQIVTPQCGRARTHSSRILVLRESMRIGIIDKTT